MTAVHTTAASYVDKEMKRVINAQISERVATSLEVPDPFLSEPSPTLLERTKVKIEKYSRLLLVAKRQVREKKRKVLPVFSTFAVSDLGDVSRRC